MISLSFVAWWSLLGVGSATVVAVACWRAHPELGFRRSLLYAGLSWTFGWVPLVAGLPGRLRRFWALPVEMRATRVVGTGVLVLVLVSGLALLRVDDTGRMASDKVARDGLPSHAEVLGATEVRSESGG